MVDGELSHRQMLRELVKLCKQRANGTVFLNLEQGHSARLVLDDGVICWVAYQELRGMDAIDAIRNIRSARLSFNARLKLVMGKQVLLSTSGILKELNSISKSDDDPVVPMMTDVISPEETTEGLNAESLWDSTEEVNVNRPREATEKASSDRPFRQEQVLKVLEQESMEYLGPMAKLLCGDYLKSMPQQLSHAQVRQVTSAVMLDIKDERKRLSFRQRVNEALKIS